MSPLVISAESSLWLKVRSLGRFRNARAANTVRCCAAPLGNGVQPHLGNVLPLFSAHTTAFLVI
jgi:hypothetical protein